MRNLPPPTPKRVKLNQENEDARQHFYVDIPYHFVFNKSTKVWTTRRRGKESIVSRLYSAQPKEGERFYLRVLLLHVPGATSSASLRTYNGQVYETIREACLARGLLENDNVWNDTLLEVVSVGTPYQVRQTFAFILTHGEINDPLTLWQNHRDNMIEDFCRTLQVPQTE